MELHRFYCRSIARYLVELTDAEAHHIVDIYRLNKGDKIELFDGRGTLATAVITRASSRKVALQVRDLRISKKPDRPQVIIAVSVPKGQRFDWLIGKSTELGIDRICPVIFERTVKQAANPNIAQRWQNLAVASAKQCRRIFLPRIDKPVPVQRAIEMLKNDYKDAQILVGNRDAKSQSLMNYSFTDRDVIAVVGPEGGVTEQEEQLLENVGAESVRITETILRVETAALAFAVILTARRDAGK